MNLKNIALEVSAEIIAGKQSVQKPKILVLMGLQYAGKSYLARNIEEKNYAHFWATKIKKKYNIKNPETIEIGLMVIELVSLSGYNLIIDFVNHKHAMRKQFQDRALALGVEYQLIFIDTPKEERLRRRELNIQEGDKPGRRIISLEQMQEFENQFEPPQNTEPTIELKTQSDIDEFLGSL